MEYNLYPEMKEFSKGLQELNIELTDKQYQQFINYYEMLIERNKVMNLTAITELSEVVTKHFIDSLAVVKSITLEKQRVLDLGTGAGFPGIPLKIVFPELDITLLDSLNKRLIFLNEVIEKLELDKIVTLHGRAEDYGRDMKYREQFDLCLSRAVANLSSLTEYCLPYVKKNGYFISYKSGNGTEEAEGAARAIKILGGTIEKVYDFALPGTEVERTLIQIKKIALTPKNYPRSAGKPSKEPL